MNIETIGRAMTGALLVAGTSMVAAPQQTTRTPGQMTEAHVWVENRGKAEMVPVDLREVNLDSPLKVQIINGEPRYGVTNPVQTHQVRLVWDYETMTVPATEDVTARLNARGADGWETTGIWSVTTEGATKLLLKRSH
jgi:hypothetical protein